MSYIMFKIFKFLWRFTVKLSKYLTFVQKPKKWNVKMWKFHTIKILKFSLADTCFESFTLLDFQIRPNALFFHDSLIAALQRKHNCRSTNKKMMQNYLEIYISRPFSNPPFHSVICPINNETPSFYLFLIVAIFGISNRGTYLLYIFFFLFFKIIRINN